MTTYTKPALLRQMREARRDMERLAKMYPACFDRNGKPLVATLHLPRLVREKP